MYDYKLTREELIKEKKKFRDNYLKTDADFRSPEAINEAIDKARKDLMFRTLTLKLEMTSNKEQAAAEFKKEIITELRKEITKYFEESSKNLGNFDTWHNKRKEFDSLQEKMNKTNENRNNDDNDDDEENG